MEGPLLVAHSAIQRTLTYPLLIARIRDCYAHFSSFSIPTTIRYPIHPAAVEDGSSPTLLVMPAWCSSPRCPYLLVKSVAVFPANGAKGLPAVAGTYVLSSAETGRPLAVMDGTELILWRTACTSAVAADYLARHDAKVMLMVGAGALAPHLVKAHVTARPSLEKILVWNRTPAAAAKLVTDLKQAPLLAGRAVKVAADLESSVRAADLISCATLACEPLVLGAWLAPGTHLDLVGSFTPAMRECDDAAMRSARVVVDSVHAVDDSGDLAQPLGRKVIAREHVLGTLADLVQGTVSSRTSREEITLYKSVGCAVGDLAAAQLVYENLSRSIPP